VGFYRAARYARERVRGFFREHRMIATSTVLALAATGALSGGADAVVNPDVNIHAKTKICGLDQHIVTIERVDIRNNNFRGEPMCLLNYYYKDNFRIVSSGLHEAWAAYPNAFVGCEISVCSPESPMPIQVSNIRQAYSSWQYHPGGPWIGNAAYDIWFNPTKMTTGQVNHGAEVMLWLNQSGKSVGKPSGTRVYIDGTWWGFTTWVARHGTLTWNYVRFWRESRTLSVTNLNLRNFFAYAEKRHLISSKWWLTAVESGYELWQGGVGMHTLHYSVLVTPWVAPKKAPAPAPKLTLPAAPKPTPLSTATPPPSTPGPSPSPTATSPAATPASVPAGSPTPAATPS
jgi:hypothetical protein